MNGKSRYFAGIMAVVAHLNRHVKRFIGADDPRRGLGANQRFAFEFLLRKTLLKLPMTDTKIPRLILGIFV